MHKILKYLEFSHPDIFILMYIFVLYFCTVQISVAHEVEALPVHAMNENAGVNV
jgi:hypothetical protein